jgi:hypothetical protein
MWHVQVAELFGYRDGELIIFVSHRCTFFVLCALSCVGMRLNKTTFLLELLFPLKTRIKLSNVSRFNPVIGHEDPYFLGRVEV